MRPVRRHHAQKERVETETVIAVGFVIHELLGLVGGLILCYFGYRLLMRRVKVHPSETRGTWNSAKLLIRNAAPGTLFAVFGAVSIWLTASNALTPKTSPSKNSVDVLPTKEARTITPAENDGTIAMTLGAAMPGMKQTHPGNIADDIPTINQSPATQAPTPAPENRLQADRNALANTTQLTEEEPGETARKTAEGERQKAGRKTLEKERRAAERKRSRLEEMYQNHLISSEAYKKGEEEYKSEIEKYRSEMNAGRGVAE
jgi:hypothetical protein